MRAHYEPRALWMAGLLAAGFALVAQGASQMGLPIFWVVFIGTLVVALVWYDQVYSVGRAQGREAARREAVAEAEAQGAADPDPREPGRGDRAVAAPSDDRADPAL